MIYKEDGMILNVDKISENTEGKLVTIELKVNEIIRYAPMFKESAHPQPGSTFNVSYNKEFEGSPYIMWSLED
jgi:hypothetical protein